MRRPSIATLPDLPAILDRIRAEPDAEAHWLALADNLRDRGESDLATVVQAHWLVCRDFLREGDTVEQAVDRMRKITLRDLARLARWAREAEERGLSEQGDD